MLHRMVSGRKGDFPFLRCLGPTYIKPVRHLTEQQGWGILPRPLTFSGNSLQADCFNCLLPGVEGGGGGTWGYFTMKSVGVLGPGKKLGPNGSYKQLLKWGSMGEMSQQGQGVNKAHPCTGVCGARLLLAWMNCAVPWPWHPPLRIWFLECRSQGIVGGCHNIQGQREMLFSNPSAKMLPSSSEGGSGEGRKI